MTEVIAWALVALLVSAGFILVALCSEAAWKARANMRAAEIEDRERQREHDRWMLEHADRALVRDREPT